MNKIFVDNFAGGGGASTGIEMAIGRSVDIAINHDPDAIAMHTANHPTTKHYLEDVWQVDPVEACAGRKVALAWFSPDCTHFSRAKGNVPVKKHIRGLAWVAVKWALMVKPDVLMLENVSEIRTWGPIKDGQPIKDRAGETFDGFICILSCGLAKNHPAFAECCEALQITVDSPEADKLSRGLGYDIRYQDLFSCDYGAPTKRKRFYMVARCDGRPIVFPKPTHAQRDSMEVRYGVCEPWRSAAECIDWSIPMQSIFDRKKPLADKTLRRIAKGLEKYVINNPEPYIVNLHFDNDPESINDPLSTITSVGTHYVVSPKLIPIGYGENKGQEPRTHDITEPYIVEVNHSGNGFRGQELNKPINTITAKNGYAIVAPTLIQYHSEQREKEHRGQALGDPIATIDQSNRYGLVAAFLSKYYGGGCTQPYSDAEEPMPTVTAVDHNALVTANLVTLRNHCVGQSVEEPLQTVCTSAGHFGVVEAFLIKYYSGDENISAVDQPLPTVTSKPRFGIVTVHGVDYIISDIKMRMMQPHELFRAMGFPEDYIIDEIDGKPFSKKQQTAKCGNAVTPQVPEALVRANLPEYCTDTCRWRNAV